MTNLRAITSKNKGPYSVTRRIMDVINFYLIIMMVIKLAYESQRKRIPLQEVNHINKLGTADQEKFIVQTL